MLFKKKEEHESFGLLSFSRVTHSSHKLNLFGSSIKHGNTIIMTVSSAERSRDHSHTWLFPRDTLIEVELSPTQFSDAITSFNMGSGVPVTIRRYQGKRVEDPPCTDIREEFEEEFRATAKKAYSQSQEALDKINHILSQNSVKKSDLNKVKDLLTQVNYNIGSNLSFVYGKFNEQVERSVTEAKNEIEAFIENKIRATGLKSLGEQFSSNNLLEGKVENARKDDNQTED